MVDEVRRTQTLVAVNERYRDVSPTELKLRFRQHSAREEARLGPIGKLKAWMLSL